MTTVGAQHSPTDEIARALVAPARWSGAPRTLLTLGLLVTGIVYISYGAYQLVSGVGDIAAIDLKKRWRDHHYFWKGQNPYDVLAMSQGKPTDPARNAVIDPELGPPVDGGYPPWSFSTGVLFVPPTSLGAARLFFAAINLLALAVAAWGAFQVGTRPSAGHESDARCGWLFAVGALAVTANLFCLSAGQYSILVNALLIVALICYERHWDVPAGLALGMAMIKPQIAGLFVLAFLVKGRWKSVATATAFLIVTSLLASWQMQTGVFEFMSQARSDSEAWLGRSPVAGPLWFLLLAGWDAKTAVPVCAVAGVAAALVLIALWRRTPMLVHFAIAAVVGRLWTYHGIYDNTMLLFLLVALGRSWYNHRRNPMLTPVLLLVALTLWAPLTYGLHCQWFIHVPQAIIWVLGLVTLLIAERRSVAHDDVERPPLGAVLRSAV